MVWVMHSILAGGLDHIGKYNVFVWKGIREVDNWTHSINVNVRVSSAKNRTHVAGAHTNPSLLNEFTA